MQALKRDDPVVARIIEEEERRLFSTIDLIAAENHAPLSVLNALGSVFNTKAAEGYPGRRFHAGCRHADELEKLAVARAKTLFGAEHANVQPNSGTAANLAVYFSVLEVGDRILSMGLSHGGHLSHGDAASITGRCFKVRHYSVSPETECIDYDELRRLALEFRPKMIIAGASSYSRLIDYARMAEIAAEVSAHLMVDMAHIAGLVAARVIPSPVPHADFVTFTTYKTLRGGRGGVILCRGETAKRIDQAVFPGTQGTTAFNALAAKAVCFKLAGEPAFAEEQRRTLTNASAMAEEFFNSGYRIVAGGTENHMVLLDLRSKGLKGLQAEQALESVGVIANRNVIPFDPEGPGVTSGLRLGLSAVSARGMGRPEMVQIVELMDTAMHCAGNPRKLGRVAQDVSVLSRRFPITG